MDSSLTPAVPDDHIPAAVASRPSIASLTLHAMFEDTSPGPHRVGQTWSPAPSNLQEQGEQTTTNLPLIAAILGIIVVVSIILGLVGWACKLHRRKMRWSREKGRKDKDTEKGQGADVIDKGPGSVEVERRDSGSTAVEDDGAAGDKGRKESVVEHEGESSVLPKVA